MIYVEQMQGEDWNQKIEAALTEALQDGCARTIVLPPKRIEITRPVFCWRHEMADNPARIRQSANLMKVWQVIQGSPAARARGLRIVGEGGSSGFIWAGEPFEVMMDLPAPWYCTIRDVNFWGNGAKGVIGLRIRAGWEFQSGGGKSNLFERCLFKDLDCGVEVGDPFCPEISSNEFRLFRFKNCGTGMRFLGGNLVQQRIQSHHLSGVKKYGYHVQGYDKRSFRRVTEAQSSPEQPIVVDASASEMYFDKAPEYLKQARVFNGDDVIKGPFVHGGQPDITFDGVCESTRSTGGTLFYFDNAPMRIMNVRQDGASKCAVKIRGSNPQFVDQIYDVSTASKDNVIQYNGDGLQQSECVLHGGVETSSLPRR